MKKELINKLVIIKEWIIKEKKFLILLAVMTVSLAVSMFTEFALIACMAVAVVCAVCFNFEKCLSLFLFSYAFEAVFYAQISGGDTFVFPIFYSIIFGICAIKYLIKVIKKEIKINWKALIPILIFMVYLVLPINPINLYDTLKFIVALVFIYLLIENRNEIKFDNLIIYAVLGLLISIFSSIFIKFSPRMLSYVGVFYNFGIKKKQAMFTNPNWLVVFSVLIIALCSYKCISQNWAWGLPLLVLLPYTYGTLSRDFIICISIIMFFLFICLCIAKNKKSTYKGLSILLLLIIVCFTQFNVTKVYGQRLGLDKIFSNEQTQDKNNNTTNDEDISSWDNKIDDSELWKDGKPIDPGRLELWKRYIKEIVSSPKNIIFGSGISADILGTSPHNSYLFIVYQLGIIGTLITFLIFYLIYKKLLKFNALTLLSLILVCFICFVEGNVFNYVAIMMIIFLTASASGERIKNIKEKTNEQDISDSSDLQS